MEGKPLAGKRNLNWMSGMSIMFRFFLRDMKILLKTVYNVLNKTGFYQAGDITSIEAFNGKN
jgi:hypothetical protein